MSFMGSMHDAKSIINEIEVSENTRSATGSSILHGHAMPGGAAHAAKPHAETLMPGRLRAGIKKPITRTDTLVRHYGSTGSGAQ